MNVMYDSEEQSDEQLPHDELFVKLVNIALTNWKENNPLEKINKTQVKQLTILMQKFNYDMMQILPGGYSGRGKMVVCEMPSNNDAVALSAARQCQACSRYFCKKHTISHCPLCGGALQ